MFNRLEIGGFLILVKKYLIFFCMFVYFCIFVQINVIIMVTILNKGAEDSNGFVLCSIKDSKCPEKGEHSIYLHVTEIKMHELLNSFAKQFHLQPPYVEMVLQTIENYANHKSKKNHG